MSGKERIDVFPSRMWVWCSWRQIRFHIFDRAWK